MSKAQRSSGTPQYNPVCPSSCSNGSVNSTCSKDIFGRAPLNLCFAKLTSLVHDKHSVVEHGVPSSCSFCPEVQDLVGGHLRDPHLDIQGTQRTYSPPLCSRKRGSVTVPPQKLSGHCGTKFYEHTQE